MNTNQLPNALIVNLAILNKKMSFTNIDEMVVMRLIEILTLMYKEMNADEYISEVNQKTNSFEKR